MRNARQLSVFLVWGEFTSQNFRFHLRFPTLSLIREILSTQPPVRGEALSLYVFYILFFFRVSLFGVYLSGFYIFGAFLACCLLAWDCFCYFWCLIGPFNFCRAPSPEPRDLFYLLPLIICLCFRPLFYPRNLESGFCGWDSNLGLHMALAAFVLF